MGNNSARTRSRSMATSVRRGGVRGLVLLTGVAVAIVGLASPSSAHHNTVVGSVACRTDGGWAVTWRVTNSESNKTEQIIESNRPTAVRNSLSVFT